VILALFLVSFKKPIVPPPHSTSKKITLNLSSFKPSIPKPQIKPKPKPKPIIKPQQPITKPIIKPIKKQETKPIQPPKIAKANKPKPKTKKKTIIASSDTNTTKKIKKATKKHSKPTKVAKAKPHKTKKKKHKKRYTKRKTTHKKRNSLAGVLAPRKSMYKTASRGFGMSTIRKLYGKEYDSFSSTQKEFIRMNLSLIHRITQRTLIRNGYPEVAIRTHQQGTNIVSFYLHPNGDISQLRLKRRIGYSALDSNTLEVIKIAYKDYPLPAKKTKIVFYVTYSIY
jgi:TonB family protein